MVPLYTHNSQTFRNLYFSCSAVCQTWLLLCCIGSASLAKVEAQEPSDITAPASLTGAKVMNGQNAPNADHLFDPITGVHNIKIGIYEGLGAGIGNVRDVVRVTKLIPGASIEQIPDEEFATRDLSKFNVLVFPGGSGMSQSEGLGEKGREAIRNYVSQGGAFLGICAGAHLANSGFRWTLNLINAHTISPKWNRGIAFLQVEMTDEGNNTFGNPGTPFYQLYYNGPIIRPANIKGLPSYTVHAYFRTEVAQNGVPVGIQVDTPAVLSATYGKGKVMTMSCHAERTKGTENFVPQALVWLSEKEQNEDADK